MPRAPSSFLFLIVRTATIRLYKRIEMACKFAGEVADLHESKSVKSVPRLAVPGETAPRPRMPQAPPAPWMGWHLTLRRQWEALIAGRARRCHEET